MPINVFTFTTDQGLKYSQGSENLPDMDDVEIVWIDVEADKPDELSTIASHFNLHELTIEDCFTPSHFPKLEDYGSYLFMIFRGLRPQHIIDEFRDAAKENKLEDVLDEDEDKYTHKIAIYLSKKFVITFRRTEVPWLDAIVRQVKHQPDATIAHGADVLSHKIIDVLIDRFLRGLSYFDNVIDQLEDELVEKTDDFELPQILELKRELGSLRQITRDQKGIIARLAHETSLVRGRDYRRYFKDVEDHALTIINTIDKQIDSVLGIRDAYFAYSNVRLNDTMRILAIITTVAAPLNIVVGIYGMNFENMPFLRNPEGFWIVMASMFTLAFLLIFFFKKKRWV